MNVRSQPHFTLKYHVTPQSRKREAENWACDTPTLAPASPRTGLSFPAALPGRPPEPIRGPGGMTLKVTVLF